MFRIAIRALYAAGAEDEISHFKLMCAAAAKSYTFR
jgi:hypothetical protein